LEIGFGFGFQLPNYKLPDYQIDFGYQWSGVATAKPPTLSGVSRSIDALETSATDNTNRLIPGN
jgi:hypothetical protein